MEGLVIGLFNDPEGHTVGVVGSAGSSGPGVRASCLDYPYGRQGRTLAPFSGVVGAAVRLDPMLDR